MKVEIGDEFYVKDNKSIRIKIYQTMSIPDIYFIEYLDSKIDKAVINWISLEDLKKHWVLTPKCQNIKKVNAYLGVK